jgi:hypothetical protein
MLKSARTHHWHRESFRRSEYPTQIAQPEVALITPAAGAGVLSLKSFILQ